MRRSGVGSGGGIGINKNVQVPVKTGSGSKGVSPGWAGQKGQIQGAHTTDGKETSYRVEPKLTGQNFQPVKFGNELALNVGGGGPGKGRTTYASGSQATHGSVNQGQPSPSRDILSEFGQDYRKP
jgi:hypothetical protein